MASLVRDVIDGYYDLMENKSDPRVKDWFMMSSFFPTLFICIFYAYFVKRLGPKLMENRKPFDLRRTMLIYNFIQVIVSVCLFREVRHQNYLQLKLLIKYSWFNGFNRLFFCQSMVTGWYGKYSFRCQPVDYSNDPEALRMARGCWWYYMSKFLELMDTIFFVLRKKNNHVSTLHVIHHGIMPLSVWFGVKFTPGKSACRWD